MGKSYLLQKTQCLLGQSQNTAEVYDTDYLAGAVDMNLVLDEWKKLGWVSEEYILDLELGAEVVLGEGSFTIKKFIVTANQLKLKNICASQKDIGEVR